MMPTYSAALASVLCRAIGTSAPTARHEPSGVLFEFESGSMYFTSDGTTFNVRDDQGNRYVVRIDAVTLNQQRNQRHKTKESADASAT